MNAPSDSVPHLLHCLARLAQLQHESVDRLALQEAAEAALLKPSDDPQGQLKTVTRHLYVGAPRWLATPDPVLVPALIHAHSGARAGQWGVLRGKNAQDQWVSEWLDEAGKRWVEETSAETSAQTFAVLWVWQKWAELTRVCHVSQVRRSFVRLVARAVCYYCAWRLVFC